MAKEMMKDDWRVKMIEQCEVSPPLGSVPATTIPLSFLDLPWLYTVPVKRIFFYNYPHSTHHFLQTALPSLKHSLSLTLQHFFPFAATIAFPPKPPHAPHILYSQGDSVSFTVAESTSDFFHNLVSDSPRDVGDVHPFVPTLAPPRVLQDGTLLAPSMALQVTVFDNAGFSLCVIFRHAIADGRAFHHFMKFWASVCGSNWDKDSSSSSSSLDAHLALPLHHRDMVEDSYGLRPIFLEELWNSPPRIIEPTCQHDAASNMVRHRIILSCDQVEKLKKWVGVKCKSIGLDSLHLSTFVVACSLIWVCKVKSKDIDYDVTDHKVDDDDYCLTFLADCRNRSEPSVPSTYFGNCLTICHVELKRGKLVGENGILEAVSAVGEEVRGLKGDPLRGFEWIVSGRRRRQLGRKSQHVVIIAGSPKLNVYETDFGWGKPKMTEILHADDPGSMWLSDSSDQERGGIEVGLALSAIQMKKFNAILEDQLRYIVQSI